MAGEYATKKETKSGSDFWTIMKIGGILLAITLVAIAAASFYNGSNAEQKQEEASKDKILKPVSGEIAGSGAVIGANGLAEEAVVKKIIEVPLNKAITDKGMFGVLDLIKEPNILYLVISDFDDINRGVIVFKKEDWERGFEFEFGGTTVINHAYNKGLEFKEHGGSSEIHYLYNLPVGPEGLSSPGDGKYVLVFLFKQ